MRRIVPIGVVVVAAVAGVAADAAPARRGATAEYLTAGGIVGVTSGDTYVNGVPYGSVTFATRAHERTFDVRVTDDSGLAVAAEVVQDVDGDSTPDTTLATFCGSVRDVRLKRPGRPVLVYLLAGECGSGVSAPTRGVVAAQFVRR